MTTEPLLLTVDRGNSTLDCRLCGRDVARRERLKPDAGDLRGFLGGLRPTAAAGLTVVSGGLDVVADVLAPLGVPLHVAGVDLPCPLALAYPDPSTLGVDRWVGAVAARALCGDAVVVDCGTAVTFNLVTRDGRFLGGAIGPGLRTGAAGLAARAPVLPEFDGEPPGSFPAVTTADAVRAGVGRGFARMVEALATELAEAAGLGAAARILTGGEAERALALGVRGFRSVPDLVHEGLAWLVRTSGSSS